MQLPYENMDARRAWLTWVGRGVGIAMLTAPSLANQDKLVITIGWDASDTSHAAGRIVAGGGMVDNSNKPRGTIDIPAGTTAGAAASQLATRIGPTATANGNTVTIQPANSGGYCEGSDVFHDMDVKVIKRPGIFCAACIEMRTLDLSFGPPLGAATINRSGYLYRQVFGAGWNIGGYVSFQPQDTLATINANLYASFAQQSSNLPPGTSLSLSHDGVALTNPNGDLYDIEIKDSLQFGSGGVATGIDLGADKWHNAATAAPFSLSGPGGAFPIAGSGGGGAWPTVLPPSPLISSIDVPTPVLHIDQVRIYNLAHTWVGDVSLVLRDPLGRGYDLMCRPGYAGSGYGNSGDFTGGTYDFVPAGGAVIPIAGNVAPGTYNAHFGAWPEGTNDIHNVPMNEANAPAGNWKLEMYDWEGGDVGSCSGWALFGNSGVVSVPSNYCTAGTSSGGCIAHISANANPSVSYATACMLSVSGVEGQKSGLIFYGLNNDGFTPTPWDVASTSFLCVKGPTQRTPVQSTGGTALLCDGTMQLDWNAFQQSTWAIGQPWSVGNHVFLQAWYRDPPAPKTTSLSDAIVMTYSP